MPLTDTDLEGFTVTTEHRPSRPGGVSITQIPPKLVEFLTAHIHKTLEYGHDLVFRVPVRHASSTAPAKETEADRQTREAADKTAYTAAQAHAVNTVKQLSLYATAWGKGQTPRLRISRQPNRKVDKGQPIARLKVELEEGSVSRGRKPATVTFADEAPATVTSDKK